MYELWGNYRRSIKNDRRCKRCWIETCLEEGIAILEPKDEEAYSGNFRIRMPRSLHKNIAEKAEKEGISMNQYCIYLLSKEFERENRA